MASSLVLFIIMKAIIVYECYFIFYTTTWEIYAIWLA